MTGSTIMEADKLENYERAFSACHSSCRIDCPCGKTFFHDDEGFYDWEEGEFEKLTANPEATSLDYAPSGVMVYGVEHCTSCDCWHDKAEKITDFLDRNGHHIQDYFELEYKRKLAMATAAPRLSLNTENSREAGK